MYRTYNPAIVPDYLQGRPKATILHCLHRQAKSNAIADADVSSLEDKGRFSVKGKGSIVHTTDFGVTSGEPSCSCKDWLNHKIPCKHFFAIFRLHPDWSWGRLPTEYLNSPYLTLDTAAVEQYVNTAQQDVETAGMDSRGQTDGEQNETQFQEIPQKVHTHTNKAFPNNGLKNVIKR